MGALGDAGTGDGDERSDEEQLAAYGEALADGVEAVLAAWVIRSVTRVAEAWQPGLGDRIATEAAAAGTAAVAEIGPRLRALVRTDVDAQRTGPLAVVREAVRFATAVLSDAGVGPVVRDAFAERAFPADAYDLAPANFADVDPSLHELGLAWGAAKAHVVLARRRRSGAG